LRTLCIEGFLDYFNLKSLTELPALADLRDIDAINAELDLNVTVVPSLGSEEHAEELEQAAADENMPSAADAIETEIESPEVIH